MKLLKMEEVYFAYDTEWNLKDISFSIHDNEGCILLSGKNGAGKSTLLNVVCGFLPADEGKITNDMKIGYLPFEHPLYPHLSVLENLRYYYRSFRGKNLNLQDEEVQEVLEMLSIDFLQQRIDQCSSGQAQKSGIACILLSNADLIIMDEPFVALDAKSSEKLCAWIQKKKQKQTFLITSHTTSDILDIVDCLLVLDGQQLALDSKEEKEIHAYFHLGDEQL